MQARLARCHEEDESVEYLQHIVENEGGMEKAARVMQEYLARAMSVLSEYEPSEYRDALANLCVYVGERDREGSGCPCSLVPGSSCEFLTCCLDFLRLGSDFRAGVRIVRSAEVRCKFPDMGPEQVYGGVSE